MAGASFMICPYHVPNSLLHGYATDKTAILVSQALFSMPDARIAGTAFPFGVEHFCHV